jgi:hypothetical protein
MGIKFTGSVLPKVAEGMYPAVLIGVVLKGLQGPDKDYLAKYPDAKAKYVGKFLFELEVNGERHILSKNIKNVSASIKSKFLEPASIITGVKHTPASLGMYLQGNLPFKELFGQQYSVEVEHYDSGENVSAYIGNIGKKHPKDDEMCAVSKCIYFDPYEKETHECFKDLTYFDQKMIMSGLDAGTFDKKLWTMWEKIKVEKEAEQAERAATS